MFSSKQTGQNTKPTVTATYTHPRLGVNKAAAAKIAKNKTPRPATPAKEPPVKAPLLPVKTKLHGNVKKTTAPVPGKSAHNPVPAVADRKFSTGPAPTMHPEPAPAAPAEKSVKTPKGCSIKEPAAIKPPNTPTEAVHRHSKRGKKLIILTLAAVVVVIAGGGWWYYNTDMLQAGVGNQVQTELPPPAPPQIIEYSHNEINVTYRINEPLAGTYVVLDFNSWEQNRRRFSDGHISLLPLEAAAALREQFTNLYDADGTAAGKQVILNAALHMPFIYNDAATPGILEGLQQLAASFNLQDYIAVEVQGHLLTYEKGTFNGRDMPVPEETGGADFNFVNLEALQIIDTRW